MRQEFDNHEEAMQWIENNAQTDSHFEVLEEELTFNHINTGEYFVNLLFTLREAA